MNFLEKQVSDHCSKEKLKELRWFDILILTAIFFGFAIYNSNIEFFRFADATYSAVLENEDVLNYSANDNYFALATQFAFLMLALVYLRIRNFDFSQWKIRLTPVAILASLLLFVLAATLSDLCLIVADKIQAVAGSEETAYQGYSFFEVIKNTEISVYIYSLLNGFYEEIYFLGVCLSVNKKYVVPAFVFSLLVRFSFHTYQGIPYAVAITSIGVLYFIAYMLSRKKNLLPFFLSHTIADIIGLSFIWYFIPA